jgi:hypothetical protein
VTGAEIERANISNRESTQSTQSMSVMMPGITGLQSKISPRKMKNGPAPIRTTFAPHLRDPRDTH